MADIARIKGNISKMMAQNAPEADIDAYVASEGVTPEMLRGEPPPERGVIDMLTGRDGGERLQLWPERLARGVIKSAVSGATLPGDVMAGKDSPDNIGRVMDLAAFGTPVNPAIRAGDRAIPGALKATREVPAKVPTAKELMDTAGGQFEAFRKSGLEISGNSVADWARKVKQGLFEGGVTPIDAPATYEKLGMLENAPPGSFVSAANLHSIRKSLQSTAQNFNPQAAQDQRAASRAISALDSFITAPDPSGVMAGAPAAAATTFEKARGNSAAAYRANDITGDLDRATTGILERAESRAQAANSGRNIDNTIRQKAEAVLEKPKEISGLNDAELEALRHVVEGGAGRNTARYMGNVLGGGGGMGQAVWGAGGGAVGALMGGPGGAAIGAGIPVVAGAGFKSIANALAKRDLRGVDELMRKRSPLYEERVANQESYVISPEKRAALARAALIEALGQQ